MAYRRPKSLRDLLVRVKLKPDITWGDTTVRQSKMQNLQNDDPHTDRGQRLGQQSSSGATLVVRRPMLSTS